jgi:transcriptional regulator with XRE-family HTH domain
MLFITPNDTFQKFPALLRESRVKEGLTQAELAKKANVSLSVLRKFEQIGQISLESFIKIAFVLNLTEAIVKAIENTQTSPRTIDEVLKEQNSVKVSKTIKKRARSK